MQQVTVQRNLDAHMLEERGGLVVQYSFWLEKKGYEESTIKSRTQIMRNLVKSNVDILNTDTVKKHLAQRNCSESRKCIMSSTYTNFLKMLGRTWKQPHYKIPKKIPYIPTEKEISQLIANAGPKTSAALRVAKETGTRIGEILQLQWTDLDSERRTFKFEAEKGSNPRILPVSYDLIAQLQGLPKRNEYIFSTPRGHGTQKDYSHQLALTRKYATRKLQNPRLLKITFHTLRHWKGTMEYHKTKRHSSCRASAWT